MTDGRKTIKALLVLIIAAVLGVAAVSYPAFADNEKKPDLESVKAKYDRLNQQAEAAAERANDAKTYIADAQVRLSALNTDVRKQQDLVAGMRQQIASIVVEEYQSHALATASQLVLSTNPDHFIDNLNAVSSYNDQRSVVLSDYTIELERLKLRQDAVAEETKNLRKLESSLSQAQEQTQAKADEVKKLVDKLELEELAKLVGAAYDGPLPDLPTSQRASAAIKYAMAQVGKSYVYGAAGPSAYDCSGLTMRAWGAAGVSLPHSSRAQFGMGTRISEAQLQPGDLVFYYTPISHVGMYIGNGRIVNAQNPGAGVRVAGLHDMPYVGAVRPG
ncbi:MAG TPA: NlpC/P60 family protein, partial [Marmoricola sp.]|nr:NlpC/P60 family protein [Marmoricola sp.]HNO38831.1 NlpC/P60 family protein [Marmoricola sp.]